MEAPTQSVLIVQQALGLYSCEVSGVVMGNLPVQSTSTLWNWIGLLLG